MIIDTLLKKYQDIEYRYKHENRHLHFPYGDEELRNAAIYNAAGFVVSALEYKDTITVIKERIEFEKTFNGEFHKLYYTTRREFIEQAYEDIKNVLISREQLVKYYEYEQQKYDALTDVRETSTDQNVGYFVAAGYVLEALKKRKPFEFLDNYIAEVEQTYEEEHNDEKEFYGFQIEYLKEAYNYLVDHLED